MFKILILSNGHGEDLSGSLIAKQFVKSGYSVHALPIVGIGNHYEKEKIKIIGKTKEFSTGGIGYNSFKGRLTEILGGEIFYLLKKLYLTFKIKKKYDYFFVVGDIVPVFFAWVCKKDFFTYLVAYSSHYEGKLKLPWPSKFFLLSQKAKKIYTRDSLTANDLTLQLKKKVSFLGNPFMDKFFPRNKELKKAEFSIGLFPGSRFPETLDNFVLILEVLEALSDLRYFQKIKFNFAIVNALSSLKIKEIFQKRGWLKLENIKDNNNVSIAALSSIYVVIILGVLLLYSSCLTYYDTKSGMHKSVTIFDVTEGVVNAIKEPFPDRNTSFNRRDLNNVKEKQNKIHFEQHLENRLESYSGWWIYGDGAHFFKDENSLLEWSLEFPNEEESY